MVSGRSSFYLLLCLKVILETVDVTVQLENSVPFLWPAQPIQLQLFFILASIPLSPLNSIFIKNFQCHQQNIKASHFICYAYIFFIQII